MAGERQEGVTLSGVRTVRWCPSHCLPTYSGLISRTNSCFKLKYNSSESYRLNRKADCQLRLIGLWVEKVQDCTWVCSTIHCNEIIYCTGEVQGFGNSQRIRSALQKKHSLQRQIQPMQCWPARGCDDANIIKVPQITQDSGWSN